MASVAFTAADIRPLPGTLIERKVLAEAATPGDAVYIDGNGKAALADANVAASAKVRGIVVAGPDGRASFVAGERVDIAVLGRVTGFSGLTPGADVFASTTAGDISDAAPAAASGDFKWIIGYAWSATDIFVQPFTDDLAAQ